MCAARGEVLVVACVLPCFVKVRVDLPRVRMSLFLSTFQRAAQGTTPAAFLTRRLPKFRIFFSLSLHTYIV